MAAGVLERHGSGAESSAGTARAPPAGLGPTSLARDATTRRTLRAPARAAPSGPPPPRSRGPPGSRSRRRLLPPCARALDRVRHALLASPRLSRRRTGTSTGATRSTSPKSAGIALVRQLGHEEPRLPPRATIAPRSRARSGAGWGRATTARSSRSLTRRSGSKMVAETTKGLAAIAANPSSCRWLRGLDLNQRPLGYERLRGHIGNPLIFRRTSSRIGGRSFLRRLASCGMFRAVSGWYGSKTGAASAA